MLHCGAHATNTCGALTDREHELGGSEEETRQGTAKPHLALVVDAINVHAAASAADPDARRHLLESGEE
jgi:hypothetical protein